MSDSSSPLTRNERMCCGARDSAVLGGLVRDEKWRNNPSGSRPNFFGRQNLTFDKGGKCDSVFRGIVRFWKVWFGMKNGGTIPPVVARIFFGRQHLTFDKGRAWMPEVERPEFCRTQNKQSVHMARVLAIFEG